jgi:hypothetical protein
MRSRFVRSVLAAGLLVVMAGPVAAAERYEEPLATSSVTRRTSWR